MNATTILGIDPGSRITGFGVITSEGSQVKLVTCGIIKTQDESFPERLQTIFRGIQDVVTLHQPDEASIEEVFHHHNAASALKLGQARGAAIAGINAIPIQGYTARQVKQAVVGYGAAAKEQVQHMVKILLNLASTPSEDAADALAIALCHANMRQGIAALTTQGSKRGGRRR